MIREDEDEVDFEVGDDRETWPATEQEEQRQLDHADDDDEDRISGATMSPPASPTRHDVDAMDIVPEGPGESGLPATEDQRVGRERRESRAGSDDRTQPRGDQQQRRRRSRDFAGNAGRAGGDRNRTGAREDRRRDRSRDRERRGRSADRIETKVYNLV